MRPSLNRCESASNISLKARLVDAAKISRHLDAGEIVLLSALAYSPSGETFNVRTEEIAARMATSVSFTTSCCFSFSVHGEDVRFGSQRWHLGAAPALLASKLIFVCDQCSFCKAV